MLARVIPTLLFLMILISGLFFLPTGDSSRVPLSSRSDASCPITDDLGPKPDSLLSDSADFGASAPAELPVPSALPARPSLFSLVDHELICHYGDIEGFILLRPPILS